METLSNNYTLKWNDYSVTMQSEFKKFKEKREFADLKFSCGEREFWCHRVVMGISSVFLEDILKEEQNCCCDYVEVLLPEVTPQVFEKIVEFVYEGETNVAEGDLGEFFEVAKMFGVKGLVDDEDSNNDSILVKALLGDNSDSSRLYEDSDMSEDDNLKETTQQPHPSTSSSRLRATDPRPCPKCGKIYRSAHTLRTHLEDKHTSCPGFRCVLCGTVAKSRNSLHSHMSRQHRGISTKDLPILKMPSPFDPQLAARLLGENGHRPPPPSDDTTGSAILDTYLQFIAEHGFNRK